MYVQTYMTRDVITISPEEDAADALRTMRIDGVRRLPVVEKDQLVGIVTQDRVYRVLPDTMNPTTDKLPPNFMTFIKVKKIMDRNVITADPRETLEDVAERMRLNNISGLPVVHQGKLVGIITESDLFRIFATVLGAGAGGSRVTFEIAPNPHNLGDIIRLAQAFGVEVLNVNMYRTWPGPKQNFTMRVEGADTARFIRALWDAGYRVLGVVGPDEKTTEA